MAGRAVRWYEKDSQKLVELYKHYPVLWNKQHKHYSFRQPRINALMEIMDVLAIPGMTISLMKNKIKNIRSVYHQEVRKINEAEANGLKYVPRLIWFNSMREIMDPKNENYSTLATPEEYDVTVEYNSDENSGNNDEEEINKAISSIDDGCTEHNVFEYLECKTMETDGTDANTIQIKSEVDIINTMEDDRQETSYSYRNIDRISNGNEMDRNNDNIQILSKNTDKRHEECHSIANKFDRRINEVTSVSNNADKNIDEFQMFADYLAQQLRSMPFEIALETQADIQQIVTKKRVDFLKRMRERENDSYTSPAKKRTKN